MTVDSPLAAQICSIFLGPFGIQGFLIDRNNAVYGELGNHQYRLSIALIVMLVLLFLMGPVATAIIKNDEDIETDVEVFGVLMVTQFCASLALSVCTLASFVIACVLLSRKLEQC